MADRFDCVVVGAGLVGLAIAFELVERGKRVCVLDRGRVAGGTTSASFAWINATSKLDPDYHRLNAAAMEGHRQWASRWGREITGHHQPGCLLWAEPETPLGLEDLRRSFECLEGADYPCRWVERPELSVLEPHVAFGDCAEGFLAPSDGWLDAPRHARHLAGEIVEAGSDLRENMEVTGLIEGDSGFAGVETAQGRVAGDMIVIAAGIETGTIAARVLGVDPSTAPLKMVPGLLVEIAASTWWLNHIVCFPDEADLNMRPLQSGRLLMGADDSDRMCGEDPDPGTKRAAVRHLIEGAHRYFTDLDVGDALRRSGSRIGVRPMPADGHSIVGLLPGCDNLFIAVTHSGITLAPVLGSLLADEIAADKVSPLLERFRPDRFAWK